MPGAWEVRDRRCQYVRYVGFCDPDGPFNSSELWRRLVAILTINGWVWSKGMQPSSDATCETGETYIKMRWPNRQDATIYKHKWQLGTSAWLSLEWTMKCIGGLLICRSCRVFVVEVVTRQQKMSRCCGFKLMNNTSFSRNYVYRTTIQFSLGNTHI